MRIRIALAALMALTACQQEPAPANDAAEETTTTPANAGATADNSNVADSGRLVPAPAAGRISRYSSLGKDNCKLVEQSDEGPYWRMRCGGAGGYSVDYTESDLRQNLAVVAPDGTKASLELPPKVARGAFDRLGEKIEWRGPAGEIPDVLVVRVHVANDQGEDDGGHLAVARLAPRPCLIAIVDPQPGQSAKARAIADAGGSCL